MVLTKEIIMLDHSLKSSTLGDRMKSYEGVETKKRLILLNLFIAVLMGVTLVNLQRIWLNLSMSVCLK